MKLQLSEMSNTHGRDWSRPRRVVEIRSLVFVKVEISKSKYQVDSQIHNLEFRERSELDGHICESSLCRWYSKL